MKKIKILFVMVVIGIVVGNLATNSANAASPALPEEPGDTKLCWDNFTGGLFWPRMCPSCVPLLFSTGVGQSKTCVIPQED